VSRRNVELVRRAAQHFQRTGEPWWELLDPDIEIYDHDMPDAGEYRGRDGFREWVAQWGEAWESFSIEAGDYIDAGDRVVELVRLSARGKGSGVPLERLDGMVWTLRDGKAVRLDYFGSRTEALEAVGLSQEPRSGLQ
jgi:ketosteroid isomerase-like protein